MQSSNQNILLHVILTPGLGRLHFFDFLNTEDVISLRWLCKATLPVKNLILDLQQLNITPKIPPFKIQNLFRLSKKLRTVVLCQVNGFFKLPPSVQKLCLIECSNAQVNAREAHIESLILRNNQSLLKVYYNYSVIKYLEWLGCEPNEVESRCFLFGYKSLEEVKISISGHGRSVSISTDAFQKLRKLSFSSRIVSNLSLPNCSESCLTDLHVNNQINLIISPAVADSLKKLKLEDVQTIQIRSSKREMNMQQCFSNLLQLELLDCSWKRIKSFLQPKKIPLVQDIKITITNYSNPIEFNVTEHFLCAQKLSFHLRDTTNFKNPCSVKIIGSITITHVYINIETMQSNTQVLLSQMPSLLQLSCKHNTRNILANNIPSCKLFIVELEQLNPNLQSKDIVIETNNIFTFLDLRHKTDNISNNLTTNNLTTNNASSSSLTNHLNGRMTTDRMYKVPKIIATLCKEYENILKIVQNLEKNFKTFAKNCFPSVTREGQDLPSPVSWIKINSYQLNELCWNNISALNKHLASIRDSNAFLREKFESLKKQFLCEVGHQSKTIDSVLLQELTDMSEKIETLFTKQKQGEMDSFDSMKQQIYNQLLHYCSPIYSCYRTWSRLLQYLDKTYVKGISILMKEVENEPNITNSRQVIELLLLFHSNETPRWKKSLLDIQDCLNIFRQICNIPKTICVPIHTQIENYNHCTRQLGVYIFQFKALIQAFQEISHGNINPYLNILPPPPSLETKKMIQEVETKTQ